MSNPVGSIITDVEDWFKAEVPVFYKALVAEAQKEYPTLTADLWSQFEGIAQGIANAVEAAMASSTGDQKWAVAYTALVAALKYYGVKTFSVGTMETLLQDAIPVVRAGLVAVAPTLMPIILAALEAAGVAI